MSHFKQAARSNDLVYYYIAIPPSGGNAPSTILFSDYLLPEITANKMIARKQAQEGKPISSRGTLSVCIDRISGRMYLPNGGDVKELLANDATLACIHAAIIDFEKRFDETVSLAKPIAGDPEKTFRIKKVSDYPSVLNFIKNNLRKESMVPDGIDIPVIEASLSRMPETAKEIGVNILDGEAGAGKYVEGDKTVDFRIGSKEDGFDLYSIKAPFIVINTDSSHMQKQSNRESMVVYLMKGHFDTSGAGQHIHRPELYTYRYLLYSGWSIEELSAYVFEQSKFSSFTEMMNTGAKIILAAKDLAEHYSTFDIDINKFFYYMFKIDLEKFPIPFTPSPDGTVSGDIGAKNFMEVLHYSPATGTVVIKSPLTINYDNATKFMAAKSRIVKCMYEPNIKMALISEPAKEVAKTDLDAIKSISASMVEDGASTGGGKNVQFKTVSQIDAFYRVAKISDFPEAYEALTMLCRSISKKNGSPVEFEDLPVIIGPFSQNGMGGGYIGNKNTDKKKQDGTPVVVDGKVDILPGLSVTLPCILVDNLTHPSPVERQYLIRHEYRHFVNEKLKVESPLYDLSTEGNAQKIEELKKYYTSPDEHGAFVEEIKYLVGIGMNKNQILTHIFSEPITIENMPVVKIIRGIINDAMDEINKEKAQHAEEMRSLFKSINMDEPKVIPKPTRDPDPAPVETGLEGLD